MTRLDWRAVERLDCLAGMWALPAAISRRLARSGGVVMRGAPGVDCCGPGINPLPIPPAPPHDGKPARRGQTGRAGGDPIAFLNDDPWGVCQKPGEIVVTHPLCHVVVRIPPPRIDAKNPRVCVFFPRVGLFYPRVGFCGLPAPGLSISLFSLRKESEREGCTDENAIHGFPRVQKSLPRICYKSDSYSVDTFAVPGKAWLYKSTGCCDFPRFPRSTGKNAYAPGQSGLETLGFTLCFRHFHCAFQSYTHAVSSSNGLIGCGSPKARGAKPHPARFAAFLFQAPLGGPNGRARALPATLRVPRSSTPVRAAAQCGSWSAVVHQARLEINMTRKTPATSFSPAREELLRDIHEDAQSLAHAMTTMFELLRGCDVDHQVSTGGLLALLEPVAGGMETLVGDLGSARSFGVTI